MSDNVWIRLGDVAEYEKYDTPYDAGFAVGEQTVGERIGLEKPEPPAFHYRAAGVVIPPAFVEYNYISLFWGDDDAQWTRDLTNSEKRQFENGVGKGILENIRSLTVKFWDGTVREAENRDEAVRIIKEGLKDWMQEGDRIVWYNTSRDDALGRKPSYAVVVIEVGEETDASAMIIYRQ